MDHEKLDAKPLGRDDKALIIFELVRPHLVEEVLFLCFGLSQIISNFGQIELQIEEHRQQEEDRSDDLINLHAEQI